MTLLHRNESPAVTLHWATFPSQVWLIIARLSLNTIASMDGVNIWNAWIGSFWEISLYNLAQKAGANFPAFQGPDGPKKLISVLAKLDCTLIWMGKHCERRNSFLPPPEKHPGKAVKLAGLAHKDKCAVIRPDHSRDWSSFWWPWQPQSSRSSFPETAVRCKSSHNT